VGVGADLANGADAAAVARADGFGGDRGGADGVGLIGLGAAGPEGVVAVDPTGTDAEGDATLKAERNNFLSEKQHALVVFMTYVGLAAFAAGGGGEANEGGKIRMSPCTFNAPSGGGG
jgi:hypothetical protein